MPPAKGLLAPDRPGDVLAVVDRVVDVSLRGQQPRGGVCDFKLKLAAVLLVPNVEELRFVWTHGRPLRLDQLKVQARLTDGLVQLVEGGLDRIPRRRLKVEGFPALQQSDLLFGVNDVARECLSSEEFRARRRPLDEHLVASKWGGLREFCRTDELQVRSGGDTVGTHAAIEQRLLPIVGSASDPVNLSECMVNLLLVSLQHELVVDGFVGRMDRQFPDMDQ